MLWGWLVYKYIYIIFLSLCFFFLYSFSGVPQAHLFWKRCVCKALVMIEIKYNAGLSISAWVFVLFLYEFDLYSSSFFKFSFRVIRELLLHYSPFHTARWSRKIARKLPECLLCERKHVPGLILGLIPGWGPSNIAGFSPGTSAVWTKAGSMP